MHFEQQLTSVVLFLVRAAAAAAAAVAAVAAHMQANAYAYSRNDCHNENDQQKANYAPEYDCKENAVVVYCCSARWSTCASWNTCWASWMTCGVKARM